MAKYLVFLFLLVSNQLSCQINPKNSSVGFTYNYINFDGFSTKNALGINGELMLGDRFGVELSLAAGNDYFNYGLASLIAPTFIIYSALTNDWQGPAFIWFVLFIPAILEQTNFHIPITNKFHLVPYIGIFKFKYIYDKSHTIKDQYFKSGAIGLKLWLLTKIDWCISANYELSLLYRGRGENADQFHPTNIYGQLYGVNISYIFTKIKL